MATRHKSNASLIDPVAATIPDAGRMLSVKRSTIYKLMEAGSLDSIKVGKRRLVLVESVHRFVAAQKNASPLLAKAA